MAIKDGDTVSIHYKGTTDGEAFDSSEGRDPLTFKVGEKQVIPGFEEAVKGMEKGEKKTFTVKSENAYGPHHDELIKEVPKDKIPSDKEIKEGMVLQMQMPNNEVAMMRVVKVTDENITVDLNHPLAGKELTFDIEVVDVA